MEAERSLTDPVLWGSLWLVALGVNVWLTVLRAVLVRFSLRDLLALRRGPQGADERLMALLRQRGPLTWLVQSGLLWTHFALAVGLGLWLFALGATWQTALLALLTLGVVITLFEWLLDGWAERHRRRWAVKVARWAAGLLGLAQPVVNLLARFFPFPQTELFTEETLEALAQVTGAGEGPLEEEERHMLSSIVRFGATLAREIMVPRIDMVVLEVSASLDDALDTFIRTGFSRVPVYRQTVDNIVGLLYAKDLLRVWREGREVASLEPLLREAYFVPEAKKVDELLAEMQAQRIHMAIVVDEYGGVAGLVTLEDIVEEIVGEIQDEYDQAEAQLYRQIGEDEYLFQGRIDLDEFAAILGLDLDTESEEADTLGGLIYTRIGRVPQGGETVRLGEVELIVEQVEGRRIVLVRARRLLPAAQEESDDA